MCTLRVIYVQQHALRLMAFGQIYKVLEMEPLPSNKPSQKYPWSDKEGVYLATCLFPSSPLPCVHVVPHCWSMCPLSQLLIRPRLSFHTLSVRLMCFLYTAATLAAS